MNIKNNNSVKVTKLAGSPVGFSRRGVAMVAVLWVVALLMLIVVSTVKFTKFDSDVKTRTIYTSQARHLANMGMAVVLTGDVTITDPLLRQEFRDLDGKYEVTFSSEAAKLNINSMLFMEDKDLLRDLFQKWGLELDEANHLIDALLDWIDSDDEVRLNGAEYDYYKAQGREDFPYNRPFYSLDELKLVKGWDRVEQLNPNWKDDVTIFSYGRLLISEASPKLLSLASGATIERCEDFINMLKGQDLVLGTKDDVKVETVAQALTNLGLSQVQQNFVSNRFTISDGTKRIESIGRVAYLDQDGEDFSPGYAMKITAIVTSLSNPSVLDWKEEIIP